jgi:hypothetical protein
MFEKLKKYIKLSVQPVPFDPSGFQDPLALSAEWTPLKGGGSNFQTHKLVNSGANQMRFKATIGARMFSSVFIVIGLLAPVFILNGINQADESVGMMDYLFPLIFGLIFAGVGGFILYKYSKPAVFDRLNGFYWKGWKEPDLLMVEGNSHESVRLGDIHAIQLIREYIRSDKSSYYSYELNLVLKDGTRLNVIDHGNSNSIRQDAKILSEFIGKPVWDAI